jgi:hypothetical protein
VALKKTHGLRRSAVGDDASEELPNLRLTFRLARIERDQLDAFATRQEISASEVIVRSLYEQGVIDLLTPLERKPSTQAKRCAFCGRSGRTSATGLQASSMTG